MPTFDSTSDVYYIFYLWAFYYTLKKGHIGWAIATIISMIIPGCGIIVPIAGILVANSPKPEYRPQTTSRSNLDTQKPSGRIGSSSSSTSKDDYGGYDPNHESKMNAEVITDKDREQMARDRQERDQEREEWAKEDERERRAEQREERERQQQEDYEKDVDDYNRRHAHDDED